jgi:hypothetical protein
MRARVGTASHFCGVIALGSNCTARYSSPFDFFRVNRRNAHAMDRLRSESRRHGSRARSSCTCAPTMRFLPICIYVHMYIYILHIFILHIYSYLNICTYIYICTYLRLHIYVEICIHLYICISIYEEICINLYICINV